MNGMAAILQRNLMNFMRDKLRFILTIFMSVFSLFVFSFAMNNYNTGYSKPLVYLVPGIIIMTVFQSAVTNSNSILEDISMGFMKEIIVSPIKRWQISIGQVLSAAVIAIAQGLIIAIIGMFMGMNLNIIQFAGMLLIMLLAGLTFSSAGLLLATISKNSTTFQIMMNICTIPIMFLSGAYIPTTVIPKILIPLVYINPLTYITSLFRYITLNMGNMSAAALVKSGVAFNINGFVIMPYMGLAITIILYLILFMLCVKQFDKADFSSVKVFHHHN